MAEYFPPACLRRGGRGTDLVQSTATYVLSDNIENLTLTGSGAVNATGNALDNLITGNIGANVLTGGAGDDTYVVGTGDTVVELAGGGIDHVQSSVTWTLAAEIENLTLTGSGAVNATGNALANAMTGNSGNNVLNGGAGADILVGLAGDDTYVVDESGDIVAESAGEGTDSVQSSISYTLGNEVENLALTGSGAIDGTGNALDNLLSGNEAANVLAGGIGDDTYVVGAGDTVVEAANEGTDVVQSGITWALAAEVENLTLTGSGAINGTGNAVENVLTGNSGVNVLTGGAGNDTDVVTSGDTLVELSGEGRDLVQSAGSWTLTAELEDLTLTGSSAVNGTGNALDNVLTGNSGANVLTGNDGNDELYGLGGVDTLNGGNGDDLLDGGGSNDVMAGGAGDDTYVVNVATDEINESSGAGTDTIVSAVTYDLTDDSTADTDTTAEGANVENLTLTGTGNINGTGNGLANVITGNSGNNVLDGGAGADTLIGGAGDDTYGIESSGDTIVEGADEGIDTVNSSIGFTLGSELENLTLTGAANVSGTGNALDNVLIGNSGANTLTGGLGSDTLNGGAGSDVMLGGLGDDIYIVDVATDAVSEGVDEGVDVVQSTVTYTLAANVENLTLTGVGAVSGTGNALNNVISGNSANNVLVGGAGDDTLDGGAGTDTMLGGVGDDTYVVSSSSDVVTEDVGAGTDHVLSAVTLTLAANVENMTLTGATAVNATGNNLDNVLVGNGANNTLTGADGNDRMDGGGGSDVMIGGAGHDTYFVESAGDVVTEVEGEGSDTVHSYIGYALGSALENLRLMGALSIDGTGNGSDNVITGNDEINVLTGLNGNDVLDGAGGADTLIGGAGDDEFLVEDVGDVVVEASMEGVDTVKSEVSLTLDANLENLTLLGLTPLVGSGNELDNVLVGNSAANTLYGFAGDDTLDGGPGADILIGGTGNDTYRVGNIADTVTELAGEGADLVESTISYSLGANLENLTLTGASAVDGTGNGLDNVITGNRSGNTLLGGDGADTLRGSDGDDELSGDSGDDVLSGGAGMDALSGGVGNDVYEIRYGDEIDAVTDGGDAADFDIVRFMEGTGHDQLWFWADGDTLSIGVRDTNDRVDVQNWFSAPDTRIDKFEATDGEFFLLKSQVQQLVDAMAVFNPETAGNWNVPQNLVDQIQPVIAANWMQA